LKPHGVYWPTMLHAAGIPLYRRLNVHGYWSLGGGKMSKSVGNVVEAFQLTDKYGHDAFRYFLLREMNFGLDANFSEEALVGRLNADLANDLGNLASRATTLLSRFGAIQEAGGPPTPEDQRIHVLAAQARSVVDREMSEFAFQKALGGIWEFIGALNRYVDMAAPWELAKDPAKRPRLEKVLCTLADALQFLGILLDPFVPDAAAKIRAAVGYTKTPRLEDAVVGRLTSVPVVQKMSALFPRIEAKVTEEATSAAAAASAGSVRIPIDDFMKVELRVAEVLAAERVPKSKKLLKLTVKVGDETRTVVAGIAEQYEPQSLVGRKVVIVANLQPVTLMGVESNGMVLAASHEGTVSLLALDKDVPPGSKVK
ncbi:MAG: methionine--tRNA ligase subunit beta, partial [Candidatus Rokubacteria bacterium]|nr:methionine--tRNA ligase subunit beta [Candidatus Rokubacteria bacterium]